MTGRFAHRLRVVEGAVALAVAGSLLGLLPFRWVARLAGAVEPGGHGVPLAADPAADAIGRAIDAAASRLPWRPVCLPRALAGSLMLRRRGIPSRLVLGVRRDQDGLAAHAWLLTAAGAIVCGGRDAGRFVPIAAFHARRR